MEKIDLKGPVEDRQEKVTSFMHNEMEEATIEEVLIGLIHGSGLTETVGCLDMIATKLGKRIAMYNYSGRVYPATGGDLEIPPPAWKKELLDPDCGGGKKVASSPQSGFVPHQEADGKVGLPTGEQDDLPRPVSDEPHEVFDIPESDTNERECGCIVKQSGEMVKVCDYHKMEKDPIEQGDALPAFHDPKSKHPMVDE